LECQRQRQTNDALASYLVQDTIALVQDYAKTRKLVFFGGYTEWTAQSEKKFGQSGRRYGFKASRWVCVFDVETQKCTKQQLCQPMLRHKSDDELMSGAPIHVKSHKLTIFHPLDFGRTNFAFRTLDLHSGKITETYLPIVDNVEQLVEYEGPVTQITYGHLYQHDKYAATFSYDIIRDQLCRFTSFGEHFVLNRLLSSPNHSRLFVVHNETEFVELYAKHSIRRSPLPFEFGSVSTVFCFSSQHIYFARYNLSVWYQYDLDTDNWQTLPAIMSSDVADPLLLAVVDNHTLYFTYTKRHILYSYSLKNISLPATDNTNRWRVVNSLKTFQPSHHDFRAVACI
jgi:hypothetical protein